MNCLGQSLIILEILIMLSVYLRTDRIVNLYALETDSEGFASGFHTPLT